MNTLYSYAVVYTRHLSVVILDDSDYDYFLESCYATREEILSLVKELDAVLIDAKKILGV